MKFIKQHYHWIVLVIVFLQNIIYGGLGNSESVFVIPIVDALGCTRGSYSLATTTLAIVSAISAAVSGKLFSKFGYQKTSIAGLLINSVALAVQAFSQNLAMIAVSKALYGVGAGVLSTAGAVKVANSWFHKHRGLILGTLTMATGFGGSIMNVLLTAIIGATDWRIAKLSAAAMLVAVAILFLAVRNEPSDMGLQPYGEGQAPKKKEKFTDAWHGKTAKELFRSPEFYLMCFCTLFSVISVRLAASVVVPYYQDVGFTAAEAAVFSSVCMMSLAGAKLVCGWLSDRIGPKWVTMICMLCMLLTHTLMMFSDGLAVAYCSMVLMGMALVMTTIVAPLLTMPLFGYRAYDGAVGIFLALISIANTVGSLAVNLLYDSCGSYKPAFRIAVVLDILLIGLYGLLFWLCARIRRKCEEEAVS